MTLERLQADQTRRNRDKAKWLAREINALKHLVEMHQAKKLRLRYGPSWRKQLLFPGGPNASLSENFTR